MSFSRVARIPASSPHHERAESLDRNAQPWMDAIPPAEQTLCTCRPPHKPVHTVSVERELLLSLGLHRERNRTEPIHLL